MTPRLPVAGDGQAASSVAAARQSYKHARGGEDVNHSGVSISSKPPIIRIALAPEPCPEGCLGKRESQADS